MNLEDEIHELSANGLAMQTLFAELCLGLMVNDPNIKPIIGNVFDHASSHIENVAIALGPRASPKQTVKALRIVEELRAVVLGNMTKPKNGN